MQIKINELKTDLFIFSFNKSPKRHPTIELSLYNTILPIKLVVKYLQIMLNSKLFYRYGREEPFLLFSIGNQYLIVRIKFENF